MGIRGEVFTTQIQAENRTYFFNVKENTRGDVFLQIVESKSTEGTGFDRHAIVVFEDELRQFMSGFDASLKFMEKNRRDKFRKERPSRFETKDRRDNSQRDDRRSYKKDSRDNSQRDDRRDYKKDNYPKRERTFSRESRGPSKDAKKSNDGNRAGLFKKKPRVKSIKKKY